MANFSTVVKVIWRIGRCASSDPDLHVGTEPGCNDDQGRVFYVDPSGHKVDAFSPSVSPGGHVCEVTVDAAGDTYVSGCGPNPPARVYDRSHQLVAEWPGTQYTLLRSPVFGPNGEVFALATDGSILRLRITLPAG